jgi:hypothetical protein
MGPTQPNRDAGALWVAGAAAAPAPQAAWALAEGRAAVVPSGGAAGWCAGTLCACAAAAHGR